LKENIKGTPCVTEINAGRFFTTSNFFTECGLNMPYIYVKLAFGEKVKIPANKMTIIPPDKYWIRLPDALPVLVDGDAILGARKPTVIANISSKRDALIAFQVLIYSLQMNVC
jgi:hypothetical protein